MNIENNITININQYGDGAQHRKERGSGIKFYRWLKNNNFPKNLNLRVLCFNCNCSIGAYGYSPHDV